MDLPKERNGLFLFHAEDGPIPGRAPYELQTTLKRDGLVLFKLDSNERLTGESFHLRDGRLVLRDIDVNSMKMSEAFAPPPNNDWNYRGFVDRPDTTFAEYHSSLLA